MITLYGFYKKEAASVLHVNDYAQLLTLADRVRFERSLVEDIRGSGQRQDTLGYSTNPDLLVFHVEDVQQMLTQHEQRMLDNITRLFVHNRKESLLNGQDL